MGLERPNSINPRLTEKRVREAPELQATVARFARALVRRAGEGELEAVVALRELRVTVAEAYRDALHEAVHTAGYTYATVAQECGVTPQAVHKAADTTTERNAR